MRHRVSLTLAAVLCPLLCASTAQAQLASSCLRPLGIPDKWIENQTPPWDPTDTFDPTGPTPDFYFGGYDPQTDQGRPMSLVLYDRINPPQGRSAWQLVVSEPGGTNFQNAITSCSGYLHGIGESFSSATGNLQGPFNTAIAQLIAQDPGATWDPAANGGRGGVINSAFAQSPRVIALPVFAPDSYTSGAAMSPPMVKIVGFFVSDQTMERTTPVVNGYLTGWSELEVSHVTGRLGDAVELSATITGPGSPLVGVPVEFWYDDRLVATGITDGTGTARSATAGLILANSPGEYPGAIHARLAEGAGFFVADEAAGDLTILRKLPLITWPSPADIVYGTPLGPQQLNATSDVPGVFSYTPAAGAVLPGHSYDAVTLSAMFVPEDTDVYEPTTASTLLRVLPAPLVATINDAQKFYLDPMPEFTLTVTGLVNGDTVAGIFGATTLQTSATAASGVGTYPITMGGLLATENYDTTVNNGVLRIVPRPTTTTLQGATPAPSTYGQLVTFPVTVGSGIGVPAGTVTLMNGSTPIASATLLNGQASLTTASLNAGDHSLTVQYAGAGGFAGSASAVLVHSVRRANTTTQLVSSLNPSRTGQAVTFTATVNPVAPAAGDPGGSVEFLRDGTVVASVPLSGRTAQWTISTLAAGKHAIQARYVGNGNYAASASAGLQQSVKGGGK